MFIVKGRLLGTALALAIAALGATLLSASPPAEDAVAGCAPPPAAAALAALR